MSFVVAVALTYPGYARKEPATQSAETNTTVEGQVVSAEGQPVADATVYALKLGMTPLAYTNTEGKFALTNLPPGRHVIFAHKESDGYPNTLWSFYSEAYENDGKLEVQVEENKTVRGLIIRLGQKACSLSIRVIDAETRLAVKGASIELHHNGKPETLFKPGASNTDGEFDTLIPLSVPINVVVEATGYETWHYADRRSADRDAIRLLPGDSRQITVELKRVIR